MVSQEINTHLRTIQSVLDSLEAKTAPDTGWSTELQTLRHEIQSLQKSISPEGSTTAAEYFQSAPLAYLVTDRLGNILSANPAAESLFELPVASLHGSRLRDLLPPSELPRWNTYLAHLQVEQFQVEWDGFFLRSPQRISSSGHFAATPARDSAGKMLHLHWQIANTQTFQDQLQKAHEAIQRNQERLGHYFNLPIIGIALGTRYQEWLMVNDRLCQILGYTQEELLQKPWTTILVPQDAPAHDLLFQRMLTGQIEHYTLELRFQRQDGEIIYTQLSNRAILSASGSIEYFITLIQDISDLKKVENALKISEEHLKLAILASKTGIWDWNLATGEIYISDQGVEMMGYDPKDFRFSISKWRSVTHPQDYRHVAQAFQDHLSEKAPFFNAEQRVITADGTWKWFLVQGKVLEWDEQHKPLRMSGVHTDITERKQMEDALRENENRFRTIFEDSPISLWVEDFSAVKAAVETLKNQGVKDFNAYMDAHPEFLVDCVNKIVIRDVNQGTLKLYGAENKKQLLVGLNQVFDRTSYELTRQEILSIANNEIGITFIGTNRKLNGEVIDIQLNWSVARGYEETLARVIISIQDITARKHIEKQLRTAESRFRTLVEQISAVAYIDNNDDQSSTIYISPQIMNLVGYTPEEWIADPDLWFNRIYPDDLETVKAANEATNRTLEPFKMEYRMVTRDGRTIWVRDEAEILCDADGQPIAWQGVMFNITEQKRIEETLAVSEALFRTLVFNQGEGVALVTLEEKILFANPAAEKLFKVESGQLTGRNFLEFIIPQQHELIREQTKQRMEGKSGTYELEVVTQEGDIRHILMTATPWYDHQGKLSGTLGTFRDITDRKQTEEELAFRSSHDVLTGLYNRSFFELSLTRLSRGDHNPVSIMVADIDKLKQTNDTLGHAAGDELLRQTADVLRTCFRSEDIIARIGGDEFGILLAKTNTKVAHAILMRVRQYLKAHNRSTPEMVLNLSIGAATANQGESLKDTLCRADQDMYQEKLRRRSSS